MIPLNFKTLQQIHKPGAGSHKGDNGRLLIIAGSGLFHGAALWPAEVASRIVDLVFFSSTPLNNKIYERSKEVFRNGIVVPRENLDDYLGEADCVLIGPGMMRTEGPEESIKKKVLSIEDVLKLEDEGEQAYFLTKYVLEKYSDQKLVIDGGALQMMEPEWLLNLSKAPIITPHHGEFERIIKKDSGFKIQDSGNENAKRFVEKYKCVVLYKGKEDIVSDGERDEVVVGGNAGMTKGGTGDVLAGIVASLYAKSPAFESAVVGSYVNKRAGEKLFEDMGPYFNASDLADAVPRVMLEVLTD